MSLSNDLTTAFTELGSDLGACARSRGNDPYFVWRGKNVKMIPASHQKATVLEMGGFGVEIGFSILTLRENFFAVDDLLDVIDDNVVSIDDDQPVPIAGMRLTYLDKLYTIVSAKIDPTQTVIRLNLQDPSR